jgi:hypothetical protein
MGENINQRSIPVSFSLYDKHKKIITEHQKTNKIRSEAAALQDIIEQYQKLKNKGLGKNIMIFIFYPAIICTFSLFCTLSINNIINLSLKNEYLIVPEMGLLQAVFSAVGFISVGVLAMCFMFFMHFMRIQYGYKNK